MELGQTEILIEIAIESGIFALIIFSVVALAVGMMLVIAPQMAQRFRAVSDRWLTPRKSLKPLEIPRNGDSFLYHNHRWVGAIAIILPVITLYLLTYSVVDELPRSSVSVPEQYLFWQWLFESAITFLWVTSLFAFFAGVAIFFRPSLLKKIERSSNRWLSTRQGLRQLDRNYLQFDELMLRNSRWLGIFLILGSLYTLVLIITFVLQHADWLDLLVSYMYKE